MSIQIRLLFALALVSLGGCETLSRSECQTADWYSIGVRDGGNGYTEDRYLQNAKACAKRGLPSDRERWMEGREHGLERYCTARNAFEVGSQSASYQGVCRDRSEGEFMHGYELGRALADARSRRSHWDSEMHRIRHRLEEDDKWERESREHPRDAAQHDGKNNDKHEEHERLSGKERVELGFQLGVAVTRRAEADRDCAELEDRGQHL